MNSHRCAMNPGLTCIAVCFCVLSPLRCSAQEKGEEWGQAVNGLQMSVHPAHGSREPSATFQFRVEIRNVGERDLMLLLGEMLANGQKQYPEAVRVILTNPQGNT